MALVPAPDLTNSLQGGFTSLAETFQCFLNTGIAAAHSIFGQPTEPTTIAAVVQQGQKNLHHFESKNAGCPAAQLQTPGHASISPKCGNFSPLVQNSI